MSNTDFQIVQQFKVEVELQSGGIDLLVLGFYQTGDGSPPWSHAILDRRSNKMRNVAID